MRAVIGRGVARRFAFDACSRSVAWKDQYVEARRDSSAALALSFASQIRCWCALSRGARP